MTSGRLLSADDRDNGRHILTTLSITGPASYTTGGVTILVGDIGYITDCIVQLRNQDNLKRIKYSVDKNSIILQIYTMSYNSTSGSLEVTEDAAGTDESSLVFDIIAIGGG